MSLGWWRAAEFPPRDVAQFFAAHGERVQWVAAAPCSCAAPGSPAQGACAVCGGTARFYPGPAVPVVAVLTSIEQHTTWLELGLGQPGDLVADLPPNITPWAPEDLVLTTWSDGTPFLGETLLRGPGATDATSYRVQTVRGVWQTNAETGTVATFTAGADYAVTPGVAAIQWVAGGQAPGLGTAYGVRYAATYEWVVYDPGQVIVERGTSLGPRYGLRKRQTVLPTTPGPWLRG